MIKRKFLRAMGFTMRWTRGGFHREKRIRTILETVPGIRKCVTTNN